MRKVIFLNVDGVLLTQGEAPGLTVNKLAVEALNWLTDNQGAEIVITSSWRELYDLRALRVLLHGTGITGKVVDRTPVRKPWHRANEILFYVWAHKLPVGSFVILDDDPVVAFLNRSGVTTDGGVGLTMQDAIRAARKFAQ